MTADLNKTNGAPTSVSEFSKNDVAANAPNAIEVDHIVKRYGDFTAVDDISFTVKEEEIFPPAGAERRGQIDVDPDDDHTHSDHGRCSASSGTRCGP